MGVSFIGCVVWCVKAHRTMVLMSTHFVSRGVTLTLKLYVEGASLPLPLSRSGFGFEHRRLLT